MESEFIVVEPCSFFFFFCGNRQKDQFLQMLNRKEGFLIMTTQPAWIILYALVSFDQQHYAFTEWLKKRSAFFFFLVVKLFKTGFFWPNIVVFLPWWSSVSHYAFSPNLFHGEITQKSIDQMNSPENKKCSPWKVSGTKPLSNLATFEQERP